ncbi:membrane-associated phospholipid phosphatase [Saccharomonospora amisosensis]|uniref:Membrane-associated phospholipid phosphatase n=1 Tax=Saccharomonospora amisosensis TaxID=1128677 RepID=A0A7X5ZRB4_9PSEU|nr:phosphatase PAP2 family protein [Saccharomonospora amisosensis]NIJ12657.1 membrane-associated phospholipid phosphatase [Saccharomonospora amisosensis]
MQTRALAGLAAAGGAFTLVFGLPLAGDSTANRVDRAVATIVQAGLGGRELLLHLLLLPMELPLVLLAVAGIAGTCLRRHRPAAAVLAVTAPATAVALNTWLLKPAFGRRYGENLVYPSGHTVLFVSVLTVLVILARTGRQRGLVLAAGAVLLALAGIAMVGLGYHYATDVVGGVGFGVTVTAAIAVLVERLLPGGLRGDRVPGQRGEPAEGP